MATGALGRTVLRRERLRALLVLRARLMVRLFSGEHGRLFGLFMVLMVGAPLALALGFGTAVGYLRLPEPWPAQLLGIVLVGLWLAWILIPVVAFSLNEGMDITRLLVYPLSRTELIGAMLLGTLFDIPTYLLLPLFIAIVVGWAASPALLILPLALLVAYVHMVLSSQIVVTALGGILASRRFRDVLIVLGAILGSTCWLMQRAIQEFFERFVEPQQIENLQLLPFLRWFPGGSQAQSIATAGSDWGGALLWLGYGLVWAVALAWVWWQLSVRLITGEGFMLQRLTRGRPQRGADRSVRPVSSGSRRIRLLPADLQQIMVKELTLIWRTPQRRVGLLQGMLFPLLMIVYGVVSGGIPEVIPPWVGLLVPVFGIFTAWIASQNALGVEEKGLPLLLLTPLPRQRFWLGKGIVTFVLTVAPTLILGIAVLYLLPAWQTVVGVLTIPGAVLPALAMNNLGSIFFPYPVRTDGRNVRSTTRGGCISGIGNGLIMPGAIGLASAPPALLLIGAQLTEAPWLGYVGALFALVYGVALFYGLGVILAGHLLLQREPQLVAATRPPAQI